VGQGNAQNGTRLRTAINSNNLESLVSMVTADGVFLSPNEPASRPARRRRLPRQLIVTPFSANASFAIRKLSTAAGTPPYIMTCRNTSQISAGVTPLVSAPRM
jgi:hypothetical protein